MDIHYVQAKRQQKSRTCSAACVSQLRKSLQDFLLLWVQALPWVTFVNNDLPVVMNPHSPHKLVFGRDPIGLCDAIPLRGDSSNPTAEKWMEEIRELRSKVQRRVSEIHRKDREQFLAKVKPFQLEVGDRVWVRNLPHEADKLDALYTGPCEVLSRTGSLGRYTIAMPKGPTDVHIERLKVYLPKPDGKAIPLSYFQPRGEIPHDDGYVVEEILGHRIRSRQHQWLVKWRGYDHSHNTWEPAQHFVGYIQKDWTDYNRRHGISIPLEGLTRETL